MTTKPVRKHYDWTRATMAHCGCGKWALTVIFDCEPTCAACIDDHYTSALENHIDAQVARIAEQQAVIDQRNGECDRLINELAALREREPVAFYGNGAYYNTLSAALKDGCEDVMPLYNMPHPAPVAVPVVPAEKCDDDGTTTSEFDHGWNACRAEVLRLNSGSKPQRFVVTLPLVDKPMDGTGYANAAGKNDYRKIAVAAVRAAGGEIAE